MARSSSTAAALAQLLPAVEVEPDARLDPARSARQAGLVYVDDSTPGIRRKRRGRGVMYVEPSGRTVRDRATLERIRTLAIPPAWTDVWICADPDGHVQATGRDAKLRKQHRYHVEFRAVRESTKFERIFEFAEALPIVRAHCARMLATQGLHREKVIAAVLTLLEHTLVRIGNEEYSRLNQSFGLTTLRGRHARVRGASIELRFVGKSGKPCIAKICDRRLARVVRGCQDLPGAPLFEYVDAEGAVRRVGSSDVNDTLRAITGRDFSAKDFRTWAATVMAAQALAEAGVASSEHDAKRRVAQAIKEVAQRLHNTPAVCRKCYVHPALITAYGKGKTLPALRPVRSRSEIALRPEERAVLTFLRRLGKSRT
jgi:DNA topoisomerase-1